MSLDADGRLVERLSRELARTRDRAEAQSRRSEALERELEELRGRLGAVAPGIDAFDPLPPSAKRAALKRKPTERPPPTPGEPRSDDPPLESPSAEWWPSAERPGRPLVPSAGWRNFALEGQAEKVIGVSVCGLDREELRKAISLVASQQSAQRDFLPVFLTDSMEFDLFREHGYVFEYLPPPSKRATVGGSKGWDAYAAERRALIERKWRIDHVTSFGPAEFGRPSEISAIGETAAPDTPMQPPAPIPARVADDAALPGGDEARSQQPLRERRTAPRKYDPRSFWIGRHEELAGDIRAVGNRGRSVEENEAAYRKRARQLQGLLRREKFDGRSAIEFGCGIGIFSPIFTKRGIDYSGVDISPRALEQARERYPAGNFIEANIIRFKTDRRYDLVLTASVLCHMVDERHWRAVLKNMARTLSPKGIIVLAEGLADDEPVRQKDYVLHRTFEATRSQLARLGLSLARRGANLYVARRAHGGKLR